MARKTGKGDAQSAISFGNVHKVWEAISGDDWLTFLAEHRPESQFHRRGQHLIGKCFIHEGDNSPSFNVTPTKGLVKCYGGDCNRVFTNPVAFASAVLKANYGDTLLFLRKRFGLKGILPESLIKHYQEYYKHQEKKRATAEVMRTCLIEAVGHPDAPENLYAKPLVDWLIGARQIEAAAVPALGIGIIPPELYLMNRLGRDSEEYKWAREYLFKMYEGTAWLGALAFFMYDEPDNIARFKLRRPASKDMCWVDDRYDTELGRFRGFFGFNFCKEFLGHKDNPIAKVMHAVEGEVDCMAIQSRQIVSGNVDMLVVSLGGKGGQLEQYNNQGGLDKLASVGIQTVHILQDKDVGGRGFVQHLLGQVSSRDVGFKIFNWPEFEGEDHVEPSERITDPDEWITKRGYDDFSRYVRRLDNYYLPHDWIYDVAADELERINPEDLRQKARVAVEQGKCLRNPTECKAYCKRIATVFNLDETLLYRDIQAKDEDEATFIQRLIDTLVERFHFVGVEAVEGHKKRVEVWDKETRTCFNIILNDGRSAETALSMFYGTLTEFVREKVGDATFLAEDGDVSKIPIRKLNDMYREYLTLALLRLSKGLPDLRAAQRRAQGIHYINANDRDGTLAYMVNGRDVYRMSWPSGRLEVKTLDGPKDENIVFRVDGSETWLPTVRSADDILAGQNTDLQQLYKDLHKVMDLGWAWDTQRLDTQFLAAHLMCMSVMNAFPRQTSIMLCAESASGKSKFTSGLIGGKQFPNIHLLAASKVLSVYTPASIRQSMDQCSLALCLEEFEDDGTQSRKALIVRGTLELVRDMMGETSLTATVGTTSGLARVYSLRFPMVVCAIRPLRDEADLSRFIVMKLVKQADRTDPQNVLMREFGAEKLAELRHTLAIALIPYIPQLRELYREISREFETGALLPPRVPARFREGLYPVLAMMKLLGHNYRAFAMEFCEARREHLSMISTTSENEQIFETLLSSPININKDGDRVSGKTTIRAMLARAERDHLEEINKTKCGVYFDLETNWIVVHWLEALHGVLSNSRYAREATPSYLKDIAQRSPLHVATEQVRSQRVIERIKGWIGPGVHASHCSVFDARHLVEDAKRSIVPQAAQLQAQQKPTILPVGKTETLVDPTTQQSVQGDDDMKV